MTIAIRPEIAAVSTHQSRPVAIVADNDVVLRSVLRSLLARLGVEVLLATDGGEALALANAKQASLVVLDIDMPGGGGLAVCRALRTDPRYRDTPVAILTGFADEQLRIDSVNAGATVFLTKPFNPAELLRRLAYYLDLDGTARLELARIAEQDRGLRLQDASVARQTMRYDVTAAFQAA